MAKTFLQLRYEVLEAHPVLKQVSTKDNLNKGTFVLWAEQFAPFDKLVMANLWDGTFACFEDGQPVIKTLPLPIKSREVKHRKEPRHGTNARYSRGCRCDECRQAAVEKMQQWRERKESQWIDERMNFGKAQHDPEK